MIFLGLQSFAYFTLSLVRLFGQASFLLSDLPCFCFLQFLFLFLFLAILVLLYFRFSCFHCRICLLQVFRQYLSLALRLSLLRPTFLIHSYNILFLNSTHIFHLQEQFSIISQAKTLPILVFIQNGQLSI